MNDEANANHFKNANIGSSSDNFGSKTVKFISILHIDMIAKRAFCISANCSGEGFGSGSKTSSCLVENINLRASSSNTKWHIAGSITRNISVGGSKFLTPAAERHSLNSSNDSLATLNINGNNL
uniref:Uncharacterized protein n=1 Tax=Glossina palpalis gambiensis TaxID=67801 RepID=A0A1B0BCR1_9MUSC